VKKIAVFAAIGMFILLLTKIANQVPLEPLPGAAFALRAQTVIQCSADDITLIDSHSKATHLDKDSSWPDCSTFKSDEATDFYLSQGDKTHFLSEEESAWWRTAM
jgi:hypothetical protein